MLRGGFLLVFVTNRQGVVPEHMGDVVFLTTNVLSVVTNTRPE